MIKFPEKKLTGGNNLLNKKWLKAGLIFVGALLTVIIFAYSYGQNSNIGYQVNESTGSSQLSGLDLSVKVFLSLIIIAALIYVTVYILKIFYKKKSKAVVYSETGSGLMQVVESVNLDDNRKIHLVKIGEKNLVIGSSENQVNLISEIENKDLKQQLKNNEVREQKLNKEKNFKETISDYFKNFKR